MKGTVTMATTDGSLAGTITITTTAMTMPITVTTITRRQSTAAGTFITGATTVLTIATIAAKGDGF
jgi:hypothetical protein